MNNEQPWDHLYEAYTGHFDIRYKLRKFKRLSNKADQLQSLASDLERETQKHSIETEGLAEEIQQLLSDIRQNIDSSYRATEHMEELYEAQQNARWAEGTFDAITAKAATVFGELKAVKNLLDDSKVEFLDMVDGKVYDPDKT